MRKGIVTGLLISFVILAHSSGQTQIEPGKAVVIKQFESIQISDIMLDQHGIIWLATFNQLQKFDGYEVTHFMVDNRDSGSLQSMIGISRLLQDKKGNIWVSGFGDINRYDYKAGTFSSYSIKSIENIPDSVSALFSVLDLIFPCMEESDSGKIVIGLAPNSDLNSTTFAKLPLSYTSLVYYNPGSGSLERIENSSGHAFLGTYLMSRGLDNDIWLMDANGLFHLDKNLNLEWIREIRGNTSDHLNIAMETDSEGNVWIMSLPAGLQVYNPVTGKVKSYLLDDIVNSHPLSNQNNEMVFDRSGNLWMTWGKGILYFNRQTEKFTYLDLLDDLTDPGFSVTNLCFDDFENLWIGTSAGLYKHYNHPSFNTWGFSIADIRGLANGWASRIIEDRNGLVWISTTADGYANDVTGITSFDPRTGIFSSRLNTELIPGVAVNALIGELYPGKILLNTNRGLYLYSTVRKKSVPVKIPGLPADDNVNVILKDQENNVWFGTYNGLYMTDSSLNLLNSFDMTRYGGSVVGVNFITGLVPEMGKGIWISTKDGLFFYRYDRASIERHDLITLSSGRVFSQIINSIARIPDGTLWLGIWQGGLVHYDPGSKSIETFTIADGMSGMSVQGILYDEQQDHLWLSTFDGISMLNLKDRSFYNYYLEDGIRTLKHAEGAFLRTTSGLFIFGGLTGITYFDPAEFAVKALPPKVFIEDFKVGEDLIPLDMDNRSAEQKEKPFSLDHTRNNISVQYSGIQYDNPEKNRFAYRLLNYKDDWQEVRNVRTAYYYDLPPGKYKFQVKAANSNGLWSAPVSIPFEITPPWWKTWWAYVMYGLIFLGLVITIDRYQRKRLLERERAQTREKELEQAKKIEKAYYELKTAQQQLIQSEKMASLGELTAGIAHEIQNPLNFVNNFSDVNTELIGELKEYLDRGDLDEVRALTEDIAGNEEKIRHHGKRADAIVKGMLQHSRSSNGQKELTNISALADEYLRLAYHGLRAKNKSFNADFRLDADKDLPEVNVVAQDIGRVLLNLINNAFYAVSEKAKQDTEGFKPEVIVAIKNLINKVEISVTDNGNGIPGSVRDKIFQPFFTTKPAGEGTGLGLSMSYDIITKGHGGSLTVESGIGEGTSFKISLPLNIKNEPH